MPPLSQLPGNVSRDGFIRALVKLGFELDKSGGKGSHYKAVWPSTQKSVTIPHKDLSKYVLKYILPEVETATLKRVTWENIKELL